MAVKIAQKESVFLDANFLAGISIPEHPDHVKAQKMLVWLLVNECNMKTSMLCIYELLGVVRKVQNRIRGNRPGIRKINTILEKLSFSGITLKLVFNKINFSYKAISGNIDVTVNSLQSGGYISFSKLDHLHLPRALEGIKNYGLAPGDAFHLSVMENDGLKKIITADKDFKKTKLTPVSFK
tara:strand:- start:7773 stop:8318 length:546 start_codon:yes stop_codon:yes gene_type:complete